MIQIIQNLEFTAEDFKTLVDLLDKYGGIEYTQQTAASYIETAKTALSVFDSSPTKDTMLDIADYALARRV
jgi:octaprenyl-diphosphate synthase